LLFLLFASIGVLLINTKHNKKINSENLMLEDQIDKQIINMERKLDLLKTQMSKEVL
jgi:hypothetical protein